MNRYDKDNMYAKSISNKGFMLYVAATFRNVLFDLRKYKYTQYAPKNFCHYVMMYTMAML